MKTHKQVLTKKLRNKIIREIEATLPKVIKKFARKTLIYNPFSKIHKDFVWNAFAYYYSKKHKSTIFILPVFWKYTRRQQTQILYHEVAHTWLHFHRLKNNEAEANKLAKKWFMNYKKKLLK